VVDGMRERCGTWVKRVAVLRRFVGSRLEAVVSTRCSVTRTIPGTRGTKIPDLDWVLRRGGGVAHNVEDGGLIDPGQDSVYSGRGWGTAAAVLAVTRYMRLQSLFGYVGDVAPDVDVLTPLGG
jgi:hypothetical protein